MKKYVLSIDEGTTSIRAVFFDKNSNIVSLSAKEFTQFYPDSAWIEQDPLEMLQVTLEVIGQAMKKANIDESEIATIGITNQRETVVIWDKNTGQPVYNAIVWGDRRTAEFCDELSALDANNDKMVHEKTGLKIDPYFSGTKIRWILDNVEGARERAENGDLYFGNVDSWIIWNLTERKSHVTDYGNASRTMLFNINNLKWDEDLLNLLDIPSSMLPEARDSSGEFGMATKGFNRPIPITGVVGDQMSATFGQCCFREKMAKFTYGTSGVMEMNIGKKPILSKNGLITTIGWGIDGEITYLLEGTVYCCGSSIQWLRDEMQLLDETPDSEYFAMKCKNDGVYLVPAFTGLGVPYWNNYARASLFGISRGTTKNNIIRATLESLSYQTRDLYDAYTEDFGERVPLLKVDGGACKNNLLMQFTSDITNVDIERPENTETTAAGAAYLAGLAVGFWKDQDEIENKRKVNRIFNPKMSFEDREELYDGWKRAIRATLSWADDRNNKIIQESY